MHKGHCVVVKHLSSFKRSWDVHLEDKSIDEESLFYLNGLVFCPGQMLT